MPTPNLQFLLSALLAVTSNLEPNTPQVATLDFGNPTLGGTQFYYNPTLQATTSGILMPPMPSPFYAVFVQNLSSTPGTLLSVTYFPVGGGSTTATFGPQGMLILFDPSEAGVGFDNVTLQGVGATVPAMVLIGY